MRQISDSPSKTITVGEAFAHEFIRPGAVIAIRGELGAGKTHFIKGIARALAIDERELTSPTFALANEFEGTLNGDPITLFHLDCYRFERPQELLTLGIEDYVYPKHATTIIEWPERIESLLPKTAVEVSIKIVSESEREISWQ